MAKQQHQATTLSPERAALAKAVAAQQEETLRSDSLRSAHAASIDAVYAARDRVEQAQALLEKSKADAADHAVAVAMGRADKAPVSIREARAKLTEAEDDLAACEATRDALARQVERIGQTFTSDRLREAAGAVVRTEAGDHAHAVAEKVAALQIDLVRYGTELRWLAGAGVFPWSEEPGSPQYHRVTDPNVATALSRLDSPSSSWNELHRVPDLQGHVTWAEAMSKLELDANTALPTNK